MNVHLTSVYPGTSECLSHRVNLLADEQNRCLNCLFIRYVFIDVFMCCSIICKIFQRLMQHDCQLPNKVNYESILMLPNILSVPIEAILMLFTFNWKWKITKKMFILKPVVTLQYDSVWLCLFTQLGLIYWYLPLFVSSNQSSFGEIAY